MNSTDPKVTRDLAAFRAMLPANCIDRTWLVDVEGRPTPQGSKRAFVNKHTGRAQMVEQGGKNLKEWRDQLRVTTRDAAPAVPIMGPVQVSGIMRFRRPGSHYRSGKLAAELRPEFAETVFVTNGRAGDLDKLTRAVLDGLASAQWFANDSQVARLGDFVKVYVDRVTGREGATLLICELDEQLLLQPELF